MKMKYFNDCKTLDEVKAMYKKLALAHHPVFDFQGQKEEAQQDFVEFPGIINQVIGFKGVTIELCGNWVWLSGYTYPYRAELKKMGFLFSNPKKLWYWRPHAFKSGNRKPIPIDEIRRKYRSDVFTPSMMLMLEGKV